MKTVHVVFNAHIDPIWLWQWQSGLDETFATCRSACDRLDAHPDLVFTRGEAWVYDVVERLDPALFARIKAHIQAGRWEPVGGWWLQPDCNQPSGFAMEQQIALGKSYFESRFGKFPRIGYNVDSFGHAATLPALMRAAGQDRYVMMRPMPQEKTLPACLFRWRGYEGGPEVTTFRIVDSYTLGNTIDERRIYNAVEQLPEDIDDTMLFAGFGDHGGGPTERQIAWFREHENAFDGIQLKFSSPERYFDAIWDKRDLLPVVTGDLQFHAIGCYTVYRPIKTALRRAEHRVQQAQLFSNANPTAVPADAGAQITEAWKRVCFNQFHDTLGGTCLPSSYSYPLAQLGYAQDVAETILHEGLRRKLLALQDDPLQRIVLMNASDRPFDGPLEFSPWLDWQAWGAGWHLLDETGSPVPYQILASEALAGKIVNLHFSLHVPAGGIRVLRIALEGAEPPNQIVDLSVSALSAGGGITLKESSLHFDSGLELTLPELVLLEDTSDTWSHRIDRYTEDACARAMWETPEIVDRGPLTVSRISHGRIGGSELTAEWRVYNQEFADLILTVNWREQHKMLKLVQSLPTSTQPLQRTDGILGGWLSRPLDGRESPIRDGVIIDGVQPQETANNLSLGIVAPEVYALDGTADRLRFTLLRSAIMAHHDPHNGRAPRRTFTDQGEHTFHFRYLVGADIFTEMLEEHAGQFNRPLITADLTRGMPNRPNDR